MNIEDLRKRLLNRPDELRQQKLDINQGELYRQKKLEEKRIQLNETDRQNLEIDYQRSILFLEEYDKSHQISEALRLLAFQINALRFERRIHPPFQFYFHKDADGAPSYCPEIGFKIAFSTRIGRSFKHENGYSPSSYGDPPGYPARDVIGNPDNLEDSLSLILKTGGIKWHRPAYGQPLIKVEDALRIEKVDFTSHHWKLISNKKGFSNSNYYEEVYYSNEIPWYRMKDQDWMSGFAIRMYDRYAEIIGKEK
jgi:hypothetical protein